MSIRWTRLAALPAALVMALLFTPTGNADSTTLLVLGDSYSSGEGLYPYTDGSDDPGTDSCHRSDRSYGALAARAFGYALDNRACSGAKIAQLSGDNPDNPGELPQMDAVAALRAGDIVALTLGGNDLDWTGLVRDCVRYQELGHTVFAMDPDSCQRRKDSGDTLVTDTVQTLAQTYGQILSRTDADVFVLSYPPMIPARSADATKDCVLQNVGVAKNEHISISADTSRRMVELEIAFNRGIRDAVAGLQRDRPDGARLHFVDVESEFGGYEGHTISCGFGDRPEPWVNTLRFDLPSLPSLQGYKRAIAGQLYGQRSLHPTAEGYQAMSRALMQAISDSR